MYLVLEDNDAYAWVANSKNKLEKRKIELGKYDSSLDEYEIVSGLTAEEYIAFPGNLLKEGMDCILNDGTHSNSSNEMDDGMDGMNGSDMGDGMNNGDMGDGMNNSDMGDGMNNGDMGDGMNSGVMGDGMNDGAGESMDGGTGDSGNADGAVGGADGTSGAPAANPGVAPDAAVPETAALA